MAISSELERYRPISTLGAGGMGTVQLAEDEVLGRLVALKRVHAIGDAQGLSRLRREALIGASISHRNLVSIYDVVTSETGEPVIVMEYVAGRTLKEALAREGKFGEQEALRVLGGVGDGLDAIHRRAIVHRDVKPANILLGAEAQVKLADLGIASVLDATRITTSGAVLGSFRYMAPEQLEGDSTTSAVDVYALAAVAFEVLSGTPARKESNPVALAHAIATLPPPDLAKALPGVPEEAAAVLRRGMARDPAQRPNSAGELVGRLRQALQPKQTAPIVLPPRRRAAPLATPAPGKEARRAPPWVPPIPPEKQGSKGGRTPSVADRRHPPTRPEPVRASAYPPRIKGSTRWRALAALLALAVLVGGLVVLNLGGSKAPQHQANSQRASGKRSSSAHSRSTHHRQHSSTSTRATSSAADAPTSSSTSGGSASSGTAAAPTSSSTSGSSAGSGTSFAPASSSASGGQGASTTASSTTSSGSDSSGPISAVKSFYGSAASHQYANAWALADPTFRQQLEGYDSFQAQQAGDQSIVFNDARLVNASSDSASVAVATTSTRNDGTKHCAGTVDLRRPSSSGGWLLHLIHINCT